ncbi:MAG: hypothetical protein R3D59_11585 [Paracoccaceae bacterium]
MMTDRPARSGSSANERRAFVLAAVILVQAVTAVFFLADVVSDYLHDGKLEDFHMWLELLATLALIGGVVYLMIELRQVMTRLATLDRFDARGAGEMAEVIDAFSPTGG